MSEPSRTFDARDFAIFLVAMSVALLVVFLVSSGFVVHRQGSSQAPCVCSCGFVSAPAPPAPLLPPPPAVQ